MDDVAVDFNPSLEIVEIGICQRHEAGERLAGNAVGGLLLDLPRTEWFASWHSANSLRFLQNLIFNVSTFP